MVPDPRNGYSLGAIDFNRHFFLLLLFLDFLQAPSHLRPKLRTGTDVRLYKAAWRGIRVALFFPLQPPPLHHGTAKFGVLFPSSVLQAETGMHPLLCCLHDLAEDRTPRSVMQAKKKKKKKGCPWCTRHSSSLRQIFDPKSQGVKLTKNKRRMPSPFDAKSTMTSRPWYFALHLSSPCAQPCGPCTHWPLLDGSSSPLQRAWWRKVLL